MNNDAFRYVFKTLEEESRLIGHGVKDSTGEIATPDLGNTDFNNWAINLNREILRLIRSGIDVGKSEGLFPFGVNDHHCLDYRSRYTTFPQVLKSLYDHVMFLHNVRTQRNKKVQEWLELVRTKLTAIYNIGRQLQDTLTEGYDVNLWNLATQYN